MKFKEITEIWIRVDKITMEEIEKVYKVIESVKGDHPVVMYAESNKERKKLQGMTTIEATEELNKQLNDTLYISGEVTAYPGRVE